VLIGIVFLAIGILALTGLHVASVRGNFTSHHLMQATYVAQDRLEFLEVQPLSSALLQAGTYDDGTVVVSGVTFTRSYTVSVSGNLRTINYTVRWSYGTNHSVTFSTIRFL